MMLEAEQRGDGGVGGDAHAFDTSRAAAVSDALKAPRLPMGTSFTVPRTKLVRDIEKGIRASGIVLVVAPRGFGKTALVMQCAEEVESDPARGGARMLDARNLDIETIGLLLDAAERELVPNNRPLIAIDDLPLLSDAEGKILARRVRTLRAEGYDVVLATVPANRELVGQLGDSMKVTAQALKVQPREYSSWVRTFSIERTLDVYGLTQGVPALVASLSSAVSHASEIRTVLDLNTGTLYQEIMEELAHEDDRLKLTASMMLLMGTGSVEDLASGGMSVKPEIAQRLAHDYPVFGYDAAEQTFTCLGWDRGALNEVQHAIVRSAPALAPKAVRTQLRAGRIDAAVSLAARNLGMDGRLEMIAQHPLRLALAGHGAWVLGGIDAAQGRDANLPVGAVLGTWSASLTLGEFKRARAAASVLHLRAHEIMQEVDATVWDEATALARLFGDELGCGLPGLNMGPVESHRRGRASALETAARVLHACWYGTPAPRAAAIDHATRSPVSAIELPHLMRDASELLNEVMTGNFEEPGERDGELAAVIETLKMRRLVPAIVFIRAVLACRVLFAGHEVADERAFADLGTWTMRVGDQRGQLLSIMLEGWQYLRLDQAVNAQFRGKQVLRLVGDAETPVQAWSFLLERAAHLKMLSRAATCEEAELIDLTRTGLTAAEAWATALILSAARYDAELAAWCSLYKRELLDPMMRMPARLAMAALGERADSVRRVLAPAVAPRYRLAGPLPQDPLEVPETPGRVQVVSPHFGEVVINLFGGFSVERNGHVLTDKLWRRRKTSVVAARLALCIGSFVSRRVIEEELWPGRDYKHARANLYASLTSLRQALGQQKEGPQYVVAQGEGVALNAEFVITDVRRFDAIVRDVLVKRSGTSAPQIIDACLRAEQLYRGDLYVPDEGKPMYFVRMRSALQARFVDCMLRGIQAALEEGDLSSASWMVDAALRSSPMREDVVRAAMVVFDRSGRRREVVDLYSSHLVQLGKQAGGMPEPETRRLYEQLIARSRSAGMI